MPALPGGKDGRCLTTGLSEPQCVPSGESRGSVKTGTLHPATSFPSVFPGVFPKASRLRLSKACGGPS